MLESEVDILFYYIILFTTTLLHSSPGPKLYPRHGSSASADVLIILSSVLNTLFHFQHYCCFSYLIFIFISFITTMSF